MWDFVFHLQALFSSTKICQPTKTESQEKGICRKAFNAVHA